MIKGSTWMMWGALVAAVGLGLVMGRLTAPHMHKVEEGKKAGGEEAEPAAEYTCSMHPQIRQPNPGTCPICAMDLIPVRSEPEQVGPRQIAISEHARALARVQTTTVERRVPDAELRLFGRVMADESRVRSIAARFPARMERLYVNYTGVRVKAGDHLARIYSPPLLTAQAELLSAARFRNERAVRAAREKLELWGLSAEAIAAIERRDAPSDTMDIDAPVGGFVTDKMVNEGDYVDTGSVLFKIADLSTVWVVLDAYEMDKPWLRFGQPVTFTAEALPGQTFEGRIAFIPPVLDAATRTFKVRVNVPNEGLRLRPGMFVTGTVHARIAGRGVMLDPSLAGKWISPMHPEIVKDAPGQCDVCGMDLVTADELGYAAEEPEEAPLLVPASAVLKTGRRAIVYIEVPDRAKPTYEGREIVLGPRAGDWYVVESGLQAGDRVVVNGAFKLDSALQIQAKPSMMSASGPDLAAERTVESERAMGGLVEKYLAIWRALAGDDLGGAQTGAEALKGAAEAAGWDGAPESWAKARTALAAAAGEVEAAKEMEAARHAFERVTGRILEMTEAWGVPEGMAVKRAFCPMAFEGRRADWLQEGDTLLNPYFGASMLKCGEFVGNVGR